MPTVFVCMKLLLRQVYTKHSGQDLLSGCSGVKEASIQAKQGAALVVLNWWNSENDLEIISLMRLKEDTKARCGSL